MPGWCEAGVFLHAPLHGNKARSGLKIHLRHDNQEEASRSVGAIYDALPPLVLAAGDRNTWNRLEITCDWPYLHAKLNGKIIHDINMEHHPLLRWRLRRGYIGLQDLGSRLRFRRIEIEELPSREIWQELFNGKDLAGWTTRGEAPWSVVDGTIVAGGGATAT